MVAPSKPSRDSSAPSLDAYLAELLAEQGRLVTPAARAANAHDAQTAVFRGALYRDLIPLSAPGPGERYAFEVDLDACSGCKACIAACHSLNGLDEAESFRDVGLVTSNCGAPFQQTVTTACHHCADPGCLNGCPVLAYEQDPATGIVRHLDDQCIGCSYCVLKCPYDVPKYNERLGIVRKCDMCHGRLAEGEAPACAQACPTHAIRIVTIPAPAGATTPLPDAGTLLASAAVPPPVITGPTTRYISKNPLPMALRAADADMLRVQPAHWPLVFLLVGTQLALGLLLASVAGHERFSIFNLPTTTAAAGLFFGGMAASVAHLGQPLRAWRVFLGLRRSWLSREAVVLGAAAPLVAMAAMGGFGLAPFAALNHEIIAAAILLTGVGVLCSAMLYIDTHRHFWRGANTALRMGGTALVPALIATPTLAALALAAKLSLEYHLLRKSPISGRLCSGPLRMPYLVRLGLGATSTIALLYGFPLLGLAVFAAGELFERMLYFRAVDAPKMPGKAGHALASSSH